MPAVVEEEAVEEVEDEEGAEEDVVVVDEEDPTTTTIVITAHPTKFQEATNMKITLLVEGEEDFNEEEVETNQRTNLITSNNLKCVLGKTLNHLHPKSPIIMKKIHCFVLKENFKNDNR